MDADGNPHDFELIDGGIAANSTTMVAMSLLTKEILHIRSQLKKDVNILSGRARVRRPRRGNHGRGDRHGDGEHEEGGPGGGERVGEHPRAPAGLCRPEQTSHLTSTVCARVCYLLGG